MALAQDRRQAILDFAAAAAKEAELATLKEDCAVQYAEVKRLDNEHAERMGPLRAKLVDDNKRAAAR